MTSTPTDRDLPAVLGGRPWLQEAVPWPPRDEDLTQVLLQMAGDGSWGRYFGPHAERLIERLKEWYGCEHVLLCCSGRAAIELALRGLAIAGNDEVALAAYDFHSNFAGIGQVGARPLLCEVNASDAQLDVRVMEPAMDASRAIIASHLHGGVVDMPALRKLADARGIAVIEDACQASGATIAGRPAGRWGDVGVLSFGGSKLLCAGRGGALLTDRADVIQRIRRYLRGDNHAYPLSEMQAAMLLPQLDRLKERHHRRQEAVAGIKAALAPVAGLRPFEVSLENSSPGYYKLGLLYDAEAFDGLPREHFCRALQAEGLPIDPGFPALHTIHSRRRFRKAGELTCATRAGERIIGVHHPILIGDGVNWSQLTNVVEQIRAHTAEIRDSAGSAT